MPQHASDTASVPVAAVAAVEEKPARRGVRRKPDVPPAH
jgi:hypothetical protein